MSCCPLSVYLKFILNGLNGQNNIILCEARDLAEKMEIHRAHITLPVLPRNNCFPGNSHFLCKLFLCPSSCDPCRLYWDHCHLFTPFLLCMSVALCKSETSFSIVHLKWTVNTLCVQICQNDLYSLGKGEQSHERKRLCFNCRC